jgi:copper homeostasis protein
MQETIILEICADSVESAVAAEIGGSHRIELCSDLLEGGVTPGPGLIGTVRERVSMDLHVMIRPRGGDFCYSADEFETMKQDVVAVKQLGADGIVFGILIEDGSVDVQRTRLLIDLARPLKATFHRAFDMTNHLDRALEDVIAAGVDRILTSGGEQTAEAGMATIAKLEKLANERLVIMAGGGITQNNVRNIIANTGVSEIHASVRVRVPSQMQHRNERVSMGDIEGREYERFVVKEERVSQLLTAARNGDRQTEKSPIGSPEQ